MCWLPLCCCFTCCVPLLCRWVVALLSCLYNTAALHGLLTVCPLFAGLLASCARLRMVIVLRALAVRASLVWCLPLPPTSRLALLSLPCSWCFCPWCALCLCNQIAFFFDNGTNTALPPNCVQRRVVTTPSASCVTLPAACMCAAPSLPAARPLLGYSGFT